MCETDSSIYRESEFISLKDAPQVVASCFKPPFSNPDEKVVIDENEPKRNIILVGHGVRADISYLRSIGYDVHNLPNLQEFVDTALMWQSLKRDVNPRNLGSVLAELDIVGWNLHNAGNDAVYTLQAMIGISIKQLYEREKRKEVREQEKKARVEEYVFLILAKISLLTFSDLSKKLCIMRWTERKDGALETRTVMAEHQSRLLHLELRNLSFSSPRRALNIPNDLGEHPLRMLAVSRTVKQMMYLGHQRRLLTLIHQSPAALGESRRLGKEPWEELRQLPQYNRQTLVRGIFWIW